MIIKQFFKNGLASLAPEPSSEDDIVVSTVNEISSHKNTRTLGPVWGHGRPIDADTNVDPDKSALEAKAALVQQAKEMQADAVVDLRLELRELPTGTAYMAYGTAVQTRRAK